MSHSHWPLRSSLRALALGVALCPVACALPADVVTPPPPDGSIAATLPDAAGVPVDADFVFVVPDAGEAPPPLVGGGCASGPTDDNDQDGYTPAGGDCNDCDKAVNPGAYDVPGNTLDEDCNGTADDEPLGCDTGLAVDGDPIAAAQALGICRMATGDAAQGT